MSARLGTLEDLPRDCRDNMAATDEAPLWLMRNVLPDPVMLTEYWNFGALRPLQSRLCY